MGDDPVSLWVLLLAPPDNAELSNSPYATAMIQSHTHTMWQQAK